MRNYWIVALFCSCFLLLACSSSHQIADSTPALDEETLFIKALEAENAQDWQNQKHYLELLLKQKPDDSFVLQSYLEALLRLEDYEAIFQAGQKYKALINDHENLRFVIAQAHFYKRDYAKAKELLEALLSNSETGQRAYFYLVGVFAALQMPEACDSLVTNFVAEHEISLETYQAVAVTIAELRLWDCYEHILQLLWQKYPSEFEFFQQLVGFYLQHQQDAPLIETLEQGLEQGLLHDKPEFQLQLLLKYLQMGQAEKVLQHVHWLQEKPELYYRMKGFALYETHQLDSTFVYLRQAQQFPENQLELDDYLDRQLGETAFYLDSLSLADSLLAQLPLWNIPQNLLLAKMIFQQEGKSLLMDTMTQQFTDSLLTIPTFDQRNILLASLSYMRALRNDYDGARRLLQALEFHNPQSAIHMDDRIFMDIFADALIEVESSNLNLLIAWFSSYPQFYPHPYSALANKLQEHGYSKLISLLIEEYLPQVHTEEDSLQLAYMYDYAGQTDSLFQILDQLILTGNNIPLYQNFYGYSLALSNTNLNKAEQLVATALQSDSLSMYFLDSMAWIKFQQGDFAAAEQWMKKAFVQAEAMQYFPADILVHRGDIMHALGRDYEARNYYFWAAKSTTNWQEMVNIKRKINDAR